MLLSERLKKIRESIGFTQEQVAQALGIERTTYTYYETGKNKPKVERLRDIAKLFGTDVATLIGENDVFDNNFILSDEGVDYGASFEKINELKKDEIMLLLYYRRLDKIKQVKLLKSIKGKFDK